MEQQIDQIINKIDLRDIYSNGEIFKNVACSEALKTLYYNEISQEFRDNQDRDHSYWHPSTLGNCGRRNILDLYSQRKECNIKQYNYVNIRSIEIFETGHITHDKYQRKLASIQHPHPVLYGHWKCKSCQTLMGKEAVPYGITRPTNCTGCGSPLNISYEEVGVYNQEYNVAGHCDAIIKRSQDSAFQIIDFKTAGSYMFKEIVKSQMPVNYHVVQVNAYMWLLNISSAFIFYENRDKLNHLEFLVNRDEYVIDRIKHQIKYSNFLVAHGKVPPPNDPNLIAASDVGPEKPACLGYYQFPPCKYYHLCWPEQFNQKGGATMYSGFIKVA